MSWKKGQSGNSKGRPKLNEVEKQNVQYFKQKLKQYSVQALEELIDLMTNSMNHDIRYKCATYILDRCYGKDFVAEQMQDSNKEITINLVPISGKEVDQNIIDEAEQELWNEAINEPQQEAWEVLSDAEEDDWGTEVYEP